MRRISLFPCFSLRGAPPKKPKSYPVIHAAYRPPESSDIDFSSLGLRYPVTNEPEVFLKRIGWSPPPQTAPSLPFQVSIFSLGLVEFGLINTPNYRLAEPGQVGIFPFTLNLVVVARKLSPFWRNVVEISRQVHTPAALFVLTPNNASSHVLGAKKWNGKSCGKRG